MYSVPICALTMHSVISHCRLQTHFDNANRVGGLEDRSGVRFYLTAPNTGTRAIGYGVLQLGDPMLKLMGCVLAFRQSIRRIQLSDRIRGIQCSRHAFIRGIQCSRHALLFHML